MGKSNTSFKPGSSGNPGGRPAAPKIDPEKWEEIRADKQQVKDLIRVYLKLTPLQTTERLASNETSNAEAIVAELIQRAKGDHNTARVLLESAFGDMTDGPTLQDLTFEEQALVDEFRRRKAGESLTDESNPE